MMKEMRSILKYHEYKMVSKDPINGRETWRLRTKVDGFKVYDAIQLQPRRGWNTPGSRLGWGVNADALQSHIADVLFTR